MSDMYEWFETLGGPHLLIPEELLSEWRGVEGWTDHQDPNDQSDYARACRIKNWIGTVQCGDGTAVVLSGDVGPIAWIDKGDFDGGYLVQWLGIDDEAEIYPALVSKEVEKALAGNAAENVTLEVSRSGTFRLIDSTDSGDDLDQPSHAITLKPGRYEMSAAYHETETLIMVVRKLTRF